MQSLLAITSELPWPLNTGGHLRTYHLLRSLARSFRVRLVTAAPGGGEPAARDALQQQGIVVYPAVVSQRTWWKEAVRASMAGVRRQPYVFFRRHDRRAVREMIRQQLRQQTPDLLYLDHLDSFVFRSLLPRRPMVVDLHNVYSTLARRASQEERWWARPYLQREANLLESVEGAVARTADALFAVSEQDAASFRSCGAKNVTVVPNGVDCAAYRALPTGGRQGPPLILYVGAMSWAPNVRAAQFLAHEVLPQIVSQIPSARLRIVGRDPSAEVLALRRLPGVEVTGTVPDLLPHLHEAHVLAVPLESGGGTRLKILEAFAAGLPVVSTPVGCEGIDVIADQHLLIAQRFDFATAISAILRNPSRGDELAARARVLVNETYDWNRVGETACAAATTLLQRGDQRAGQQAVYLFS